MRSQGRAHGGGRLAAPEREFLTLFVLALGLAGAALFLGGERLGAADRLLSGAALLSGLGMLGLGYYAARGQKPAGRG